MPDFGSPNMSDSLLLVSVEDLINIALGPVDHNAINYKLIQTILHILARQMRLLEQRVEIRITDEHLRSPGSPKQRTSPTREERMSRSPEKEKDKAQREKEKRQKEIEKAERAASMQKEKADKAAFKDREKADRAVSKEKDKADKDKEKTEKTTEKGERAASKERDKAERAAAKEAEKADKRAAKEADKAERAASKERDKADRAVSKEREKAEKDAAKEKEKDEKASAKDKDKAGKEVTREKEKPDKAKGKEKAEKEAVKEKEKAGKEDKGRAKSKERGKSRTVSDTSIVISEVERRKEKVLVVEKGPTTRAEKGREGIEVVTRSQFEIVEALVRDLQKRAGPLPPPALPDNEKLRNDLVKGNASLTDTMQAMQVTARVRAAEQAIGRMGELLTALAAAGALPEDMAGQIGGVKFEPPDADAETITTLPMKTKSAVSRKSVAIDPMAMTSETSMGRRPSMARPSVAGVTSRASVAGVGSATSRVSLGSMAGLPPVTHPEMDEAIRSLREDLSNNVQVMTAKATAVAEHAAASAKAVSDKLDIALKLDSRISTLYSLTSDYAEQLSGFDAGLTTQMQSFRDQMAQMRGELQAGLTQLEQVNNNAETAAVLELTERYEGLVTELDHTVHAHRTLTTFQKQLGDELHSLVECVEMLREQKADRDEVLDGLRDKADNSRLQGLLTAIEFAHARLELEKRLDVCHDKFRRQENVWMTALRDLTDITENKAEITQLLAAREDAENMLRELQDKQMRLALILGEPKAAMLTRELARGAVCGSCMAPALMEPQDASYGAPPPLPAMRPRPVGGPGDEPCVPEWHPPEPPDDREHICHRWVGGSHTLLSEAVTREVAPPVQLQVIPTKRYTGYGSDGRLYMLEEELQPCVECNKLPEPIPEESTPEQGAGDQGPPPPAV